jgi:putative aldouronate transport system permease protein
LNTEAPVPARRSSWRIVRREYVLYLFLIPAVGFTFLFAYLPMFMNVIAFMDYSIFSGWLGLGSTWVGLKWFQRFLSDPDFYAVAWRTLYYSVIKLAFAFPAPIILALLLNELRNQAYKRAVQTISYMPFFVSWVTVGGLIYMFLSTSSGGLVNNILEVFGGRRIIFMSKSVYFLPVLVVSELWKNTGWGSIIYIAAISSLDLQLYEAARIDGAGRWRQMLSITLPGILPAVVIILILTAGGIFAANFDQMVNLQNPVIKSDTNVINVYSYYVGVVAKKYAMGTAINFFQAVVNFALVLGTNFLAKRIRGTGLF